ncbi:Ig-like domain-containing protein, partial [Pantoea sp.]|uniref:Ig-like domain-containing protein n=1 Tax=Pantoea sp. TaxID=69393 RepID=UPI0031E2D82F
TDPAGNESPKSTPVIVDLDTTAPDAPVIGDLKDGNGADLSAGGLTNNGSVEMSGTGGTEGDIVKLYDGTTLIGSTTVGADGSWTIPADISGDDEHSLSASFTDPAGNESPKSTPVIIDLDTTAPDAPLIGDLKDGNGVDLSTGGLTNNGSVEMSGTGGTEGDIVKLYDGTTLIGSTTVGADGSWSIPADISGDDEHCLSASFTDPAGNESPKSTPVIVDLDTTAPDAPVIGDLKDGNGADLSAGGLTNNGSVEMSGTGGTEGDIVKLYDGSTLIGSTTVGADGSWTIPADISGDDEHSLSASFTDPAGNESPKSTPVIVDLDTTAPDAPVIGDLKDGNGADLSAGGLTNNGSVEMSGTGGTEGDIVKLYDGTTLIGSTTVGADGSWSIPADISGDVEHSLSASFTDPAGNESLKSTPVLVDLDTTAPDAPVFDAVSDGKGSNLLAGGLTNNGSLTLSGTGTFGDIVKIYDGATVVGSAMVGADGSWSIPANISGDTEHELSATYTDPAGNESVHSSLVTVDLDTNPPDAPVISVVHDGKGTPTDLISNGLTNNANITVGGVGGTAGEIVKLYNGLNGNLIGSSIVNADGSWSIITKLSTDGARDLQATFTDAAGNESLYSAGVEMTLDTTVANMGAPIITNSSGVAIAYGANTNEVRPLVSGTAEPFATITLRIALSQNQGWGAGNRVFTTTADENGNWSIQVVQKLPDGDMFFRTSQTDLAGNSSPLGSQGKIHILGGSSAAAGPDPVQPMTIDSNSDEHSSLMTTDHAHTQAVDDVQHSHAAPVEEAPIAAAVAEPTIETTEPAQQQEKAEAVAAPTVADDHPISLANLPELQQEAHTVSLEGNGTEDHIKITIDDVLTFGKEDLFIEDGHKQLLVTGDESDSVSLEAVNGDKGIQNWNAQGEVTVEGTVYNIYQNDNHEVDVLIQQGVQTHHN